MKGKIEKITDNEILQILLIILLIGGVICAPMFLFHYIILFCRVAIDEVILDWEKGDLFHHISLIYDGVAFIVWFVGYVIERRRDKK